MSDERKKYADPERMSYDAFSEDPHLEKVELPDEQMADFAEVQPFDHVWIWALLGIETLVILLPLILTGQPWWVILVAMSVMALSLSMISALKLRTRIDDYGVHWKMTPFHWKEKTISWEDMDSIHVRTYAPIAEYGGWGIRIGRAGTAYNVKGNQGIQIVKKNGKRILIGTQQAEEVARVLDKKPLTV
jgi:hypothetical protein